MHTVDVLGNWSDGHGPLHRKLASAIQAAIERGELAHGTRLPPERGLAAGLAVSRSTLLAAFEHLKHEGWLRSRQGSGTWVSDPRAPAEILDSSDPIGSLRANAFLRAGSIAQVDFTIGALPALPCVRDAVRRIGDAMDGVLEGHGYAPEGLGLLRERVAESFTRRSVSTTPSQILITTGDQQALNLIAGLYLRPGDAAIVEDPTSPGVLDVFRSAGADLYGVPVGPEGMRVESLAQVASAVALRLVYVIPSFQNPTGTVLSGLQRRRIAWLAERHDLTVIEDLSHGDLPIDDEPLPPPIASYEGVGNHHVLSVGSMSKLFWSGLRVGWIRGPMSVISRLARLKAVADLGTPVLSQWVASDLLERVQESQRARRRMLAERSELMIHELSVRFPDWSWAEPRGGPSLWVQVPSNDASGFAQLALREGVAVVPGPLLSPVHGQRDRLRISYTPEPDAIVDGVERLSKAWSIHQAGHSDHTSGSREPDTVDEP